MADRGLNQAFLSRHAFASCEQALAFARRIARIERTETHSLGLRNDRVVLLCSFPGCNFRVVVRLEDDGLWHFNVDRQHRGHYVGQPVPRHRNRPSQVAWIRQQRLRFADVMLQELQEVRMPVDDAVMRPILLDPASPDVAGRIHSDRWMIGSGDGFEALGMVFNVGNAEQQLIEYLSEQTVQDYQAIFGEVDQEELYQALASVAAGPGGEMVDTVAQSMVDCTGIAIILYQGFGGAGAAGEVSLLLPRITTQTVVSSRCLVVSHGAWSVADWSLRSMENDAVPLYGLPAPHQWWRERFHALNNAGTAVLNFQTWGHYASHNAVRRLRRLDP